jgi:rRNA maturation endonuclease Nob1
MGYLRCEKCKEEFELNPDENPENFNNECDECGGKLRYIEIRVVPRKEIRKGTRKRKKTPNLSPEQIQELQKIKQYQENARKADRLYKAYVTDGVSRLDKINGRFLATQTLMLEKIIEQNNHMIELLEIIAERKK